MVVRNINGTGIDFDAAVVLMDDEIREDLNRRGIYDEQEFFTEYENAHRAKYGEEWELSKINPTF